MSKKKTTKAKALPSAPAPDFQSIILKLQQYWLDWGCVLWQPYNEKLGAGTMNPATFLRVLGPEPWNVAYVEPSVRPDDGRYGENPNRLQQHYQFQVILKPDPGNPQEIYLRSLQAIGIDVHKHDIRFVEDNWASPALGAWGLGWEVWLDGLEITQFTYFQQAGGITLDPVSVEITYGLDRIAMALQGAHNVGDVRWSTPTRGGKRTWGDLNLQGEREHSKYYFEVADVDRLRQMYELYEQEAKSSLAAGLMLPAYDYVLRSSHTFNVLDARGAIGVTERQAYFRRMRALSSAVAEAYVADRQRQEFPWLDNSTRPSVGAGFKPARLSGPKTAADFLLEIGTEELPPADLEKAIFDLGYFFKHNFLDIYKIKHGEIQTYGTPRRIVLLVKDLAPRQDDYLEQVKGPPEKAAFNSAGEPTPALLGWAKQHGLLAILQEMDNGKLLVKEIGNGRYVSFQREVKGEPTVSLISRLAPTVVFSGLKFDKSMRWNASGATFSRPVRWLLALHGECVVPIEYAGLQSGKHSRGLRIGTTDTFAVTIPKDYFAKLKKQGILLDVAERRAAIKSQVEKLAKAAGGRVPQDEELLSEVTYLVEAPTALSGQFDQSFLNLPSEVLIGVMKKHQRYFPIEVVGAQHDAPKLLNAFIAVANGDIDPKAVTAGNADVLRARFADAAYFIKRDREHKLEDFVEKLKQLTFQKELGSMWDKTKRIVALTKQLSSSLQLNPNEAKTAERAAHLSKADLVTKMVIEMTSLQGVMGRYYALESGEKPEVAETIFEHYLPRYSGDATPKSKPGLAIGIADRLDSLAGLFGVGLAPTGAKDPFAQRRAAIGLVQNLIAWDLDFDLRQGIAWATAQQPVLVKDEAQQAAFDFIVGRLRALLLEAGERHDVVDAVLAAQGGNPAAAARAVKELAAHVARKDWPLTLAAFARCVRITRDLKETYSVNEAALADDAEKSLLAALMQAEVAPRRQGSVDDFLKAFTPMIPAINTFFEKVMVMTEDESVRRNRLGLLQRVAALANAVADFSKLEGF